MYDSGLLLQLNQMMIKSTVRYCNWLTWLVVWAKCRDLLGDSAEWVGFQPPSTCAKSQFAAPEMASAHSAAVPENSSTLRMACPGRWTQEYMIFRSTRALVPGKSNKLGEWVTEWLSTRFFTAGWLSNGGCYINKIWHSGSLGVRMMPECRICASCTHSTAKAHDTTLDDEKYDMHRDRNVQ